MPVSVIQLTDLHLFADTEQAFKGQQPWQNLLDLLAQIQQQGWPDLFLLTGDLSQDESFASYQKLHQLMEGTGVPWYWIPGNHDQIDLMARLKPVEFSVCIGRWQWLLLDSHSGQPHGELNLSQRTQLQDALEQQRNQPEPAYIGVAVHHHSLLVGPERQGLSHTELTAPEQVAGIDQIPLRDEGSLWQTLAQYPAVKAVICGHVHQAHEIERDGLTLYTTPATSIQFAAGINDFELDNQAPGYRYFELGDQGQVTSKLYRRATNFME